MMIKNKKKPSKTKKVLIAYSYMIVIMLAFILLYVVESFAPLVAYTVGDTTLVRIAGCMQSNNDTNNASVKVQSIMPTLASNTYQLPLCEFSDSLYIYLPVGLHHLEYADKSKTIITLPYDMITLDTGYDTTNANPVITSDYMTWSLPLPASEEFPIIPDMRGTCNPAFTSCMMSDSVASMFTNISVLKSLLIITPANGMRASMRIFTFTSIKL